MAQVSVAQIQYLLGITAKGQATMANSLPVALASDQSALQVIGKAASGAAASGNPVLVAGSDGNARTIATDANGRVYVNINGTVPVSGTVTATASGDHTVVGKVADGAVVAGMGNPVVMAGEDGANVRSILTDASGRQVVNINGTVPVSGTFWQVTQPVSGTVTAAQATAANLRAQTATESATGAAVPAMAGFVGGGAAGGAGNLTGATVKAASTAAAATDTALVVQLAPNQPNLSTAFNVTAAQATAANLRAQTATESATGAAVPATAGFIGGGAAGGAGNLTGATVKAASTAAVATDTALVVALSPNNNSLANALFTKHTDGTNTAAVKAASTAAAAADPASVVSLSPNSPAKIFDGTNTAAVKAASTAPAAADPALVVTISPHSLVNTVGGATFTKIHAAATNNAAVVKASAGQVYGWYFFNNSAATKFVKLYNKTTTPAPATDNGVLAITIAVPAGGGTNVFWAAGVAFGTGIGIAIVNLVSETDNTSVAAADVTGWLLWK